MAVNSHWSQEKVRFALIAVFGGVIGWIIGNVWLGVALTFMLYCGWILYQARQVDQWLQKGAKRSTAPDTVGVIGHIEQLIFRRKQSNNVRKQRLKKIVGWYNRSASALPDGTVVTDGFHEIVWANEAALRYLGIRGSRDAGQRIDNLVRDPVLQEYIQSSDNDNEEIEITSPVNRNMTLSIRRVTYAENLYLFTARDISQRVQLRETRAAFVANASHELKTPLTVVSGYLEMLGDDKTLPEQTQHQIRMAEVHAKRMTDIVTDLLTLSRLENQELDQSQLEELPVANILDETVAALSTPEANFLVDTDNSLWLLGSDTEIKSVCTNLCQNAAQHNEPGTQIRVTWARNTEGDAVLSVTDNGKGIDPQHITHITERFYRVDSESGGTGLGLAIVKHIVNRHQGKLDIESTPGVGTTFSVIFPAEVVLTREPAGATQNAINS
jgi:two-component system phosphate regulon sensor histidine kinase PhoR